MNQLQFFIGYLLNSLDSLRSEQFSQIYPGMILIVIQILCRVQP